MAKVRASVGDKVDCTRNCASEEIRKRLDEVWDDR
jgi:hypothetical protein